MMILSAERLRFQERYDILLLEFSMCVARPQKLFKLKSEVSKLEDLETDLAG
jgi:hypothetical protein